MRNWIGGALVLAMLVTTAHAGGREGQRRAQAPAAEKAEPALTRERPERDAERPREPRVPPELGAVDAADLELFAFELRHAALAENEVQRLVGVETKWRCAMRRAAGSKDVPVLDSAEYARSSIAAYARAMIAAGVTGETLDAALREEEPRRRCAPAAAQPAREPRPRAEPAPKPPRAEPETPRAPPKPSRPEANPPPRQHHGAPPRPHHRGRQHSGGGRPPRFGLF